MAADGVGDALDALRSALASSGGSLENVHLFDRDGQRTEDAQQAVNVQLGQGTDAPTFPTTHTTRLARSRNSAVLDTSSKETPTSAPGEFFNLDAIIFALQTASVQGGLYVVQATGKGFARFDAIERNDILAYLQGKRDEWEGVLDVQELQVRQSDAGLEAGPSTTPPGTPPQSLKQLHNASKISTRRPYVPSKADAAFVKKLKTSGTEINLQNRNDAMHGSHPWTKTADFSNFRAALAPTIDAARKAAGGGGARHAPPVSTSSSAPARKQRAQDPIIILSNSPTSLINMFNVKALLENGTFIDPTEARRAAGGVAESIVVVNHRISSKPAPPNARAGRVLIVDNIDALARLGGGGAGIDVWNRVIAVFTTGQVWQFKNYPWTEARELFKHVMGVYVRWHNEPKTSTVRDWPVTELVIDRSKRHTDRQIVSHFWRNVENFVGRRKPQLL